MPVSLVMRNQQERDNFTKRLKDAIEEAMKGPMKVSAIAREFNLRTPHEKISPHAVRRWMFGESIPTYEKIEVLAAWLNVHGEWLFRGTGPRHVRGSGRRKEDPTDEELELLADFKRLTPIEQKKVRKLIGTFLNK